MIQIERAVFDAICDQAFREYPLEMCGLVAGLSGGDIASLWYPCHNDDESAKVYTINPKDHLRAEIDADDRDMEINGVVHSHTHSEAYPSPTDVRRAPDPAWHYVIVSLKRETPEIRSYRIVDDIVTEEPVEII